MLIPSIMGATGSGGMAQAVWSLAWWLILQCFQATRSTPFYTRFYLFFHSWCYKLYL